MYKFLQNLVHFWAIGLCLATGEDVFGQTSVTTTTPKATVTKEKAPSVESQRLPVPSDDVRQKTLKAIQDIYKEEIKTANTAEKRQALAQKMLQKSRQMTDDADGRFELLRLSLDVASQAGDVNTAWEAAEETADLYTVDVLALKTDALSRLFKAARNTTERKTLIEHARRLMEKAVAEEHYEVAQQVGGQAMAEARKTNDDNLIRLLFKHVQGIKKQVAVFAVYQKGQETLAKDPDDKEANLAVGRYLCLVRGDWDSGLLHLAKGSEGKLSKLAQNELANPPTDSEGQIGLADAWWDLAHVQDGCESKSMQLHAGLWYHRAQDKLPNSLVKAKVEKRLAEITEQPKAANDEGKMAESEPTNKKWPSNAASGKATGVKPTDQNKVVEGIGWGAFRIGATSEELIKAVGPSDPDPDGMGLRMRWQTRYHIVCMIDEFHCVYEVQFSPGFTSPLSSGIKIGSSEKEVLAAYGAPDKVVQNPPRKLFRYNSHGVFLWIRDGGVITFTTFQPTTTTVISLRKQEQVKARNRMACDKKKFSEQELADMESLTRIADENFGTEAAWNSMKTLVQKYKKANRTGCSLVYLGQMSRGDEQIAYFKQAIADYSDCYYGDGVQVGAFARFLLGQIYLKSKNIEDAKTLFDEIRRCYPDSIDHRGVLLVSQLP